ncbi:MAG: hypothetical protein L3J53_08050 [Proteobacteria bacterium]|nr:hypothetical protein [Pseudomonadota bacterium]
MKNIITIIFAVLIQFIGFSSLSLAGEPFVYTPHFSTDIKKMEIDQFGITVVTANRFPVGTKPVSQHIVIYNLDHSRSLNWITEDDKEAELIDSIITTSAIFILHTVTGQTYQTEISKFNRVDGALVWRKGINDQPGKGKLLAINEDSNTIAVAGEHENAIQVWWYDTDGIFQSHWSKDLSPFINVLNPGSETITALHLLSDNSVVSVSKISAESVVRVIRTNIDSEEVFDYSHQGHAIGRHPPTLLTLTNDNFVITYIDENQLGIPRFVQFALNIDGDELFSKHSDDNAQWGIAYTGNILHTNNNILNVWQTSGTDQNLQIFQTDVNGNDSHLFSYAYSGIGHFRGVRQMVLSNQGGLFMIASRKDPFPEKFTDTLYLQWTADGQLCNQTEVDGSDFNPFLQLYNKNVYELRYIGEHVPNGRALHVIQHPLIDACLSDIIFAFGFEVSQSM